MRKVDMSFVSDTNGMPIKAGVIKHLQNAYTEPIAEGIKAMIGPGYDPTKVYILRGCMNSGTAGAYIISEGSVFFNGEVYMVPAASSFTPANPNVAVGVITTSYFAASDADPIEFTDGTPRNVLQIRQIVIQSGLSGSGAGDFNAFRVANPVIGAGAIIWFVPPAHNLADFNGAGIGITAASRGLAWCDGQNGRPNIKGRVMVGVDPTQGEFAAVDQKDGSKALTINRGNLPAVGIDVPFTGSTTDSPGDDRIAMGGDTSIPNQKITTENLGSGTPLASMNPYYTAIPCIRLY